MWLNIIHTVAFIKSDPNALTHTHTYIHGNIRNELPLINVVNYFLLQKPKLHKQKQKQILGNKLSNGNDAGMEAGGQGVGYIL